MENTVKISCSAVTRTGSDRVVNENRIYANGKFLQSSQTDNSQISLETSDNLFIFAISNGMDIETEDGSRISIIEDLKKFHKKAKSSSKDIHIKLDEMVEYVQQSNNLIYSMSLNGDEIDTSHNTAFASLFIDGGSIAAVNLGNCRIYKLEADLLKPVINDIRRTERLLKMGIINNEQAEMLSGQQKSAVQDGSHHVKKSDILPVKEGSEYLICSNSLVDAVNEDSIFMILTETREIDEAAALLVKEAIENGSDDNISAMVVKIEQMDELEELSSPVRHAQVRRVQAGPARYSRMVRKKSLDMAKLVTAFIMLAVIAVVIFATFNFWLKHRPDMDKDVLADNTQQTTESGGSTADGAVPDESEAIIETTQSSITSDSEETTAPAEIQQPDGNDGIEVGENTKYTVKAGDNLMKISKKFYGVEGKYTLIMEANGITDPDKIQLGQVLKIPPMGDQ